MFVFKQPPMDGVGIGITVGKVYRSIHGWWVDDQGAHRWCPFTSRGGIKVYQQYVIKIDLKDYEV